MQGNSVLLQKFTKVLFEAATCFYYTLLLYKVKMACDGD